MNVTILSVSIATQPNTRGGSYQIADVAYKNNTFQGKVEGKKVVSFGKTEAAFKALATANPGDTYDVTVEKDGQYNVWTNLVKAGTVQQGAVAGGGVKPQGASGATRSSQYESAEERKERQRSIVRQSSLGHAVATVSVGSKSVDPAKVIEVAKQYEAYVWSTEPIGGKTGFDDVPDFDPNFQPE